MRTPIIVVEHGDVTIFESVAKAQLSLEPIDVRNGEFVAYDRSGRLLRLTTIKKEKPSFFCKEKSIEAVKIGDVEDDGVYAKDLREVLINFFKRTGVSDPEDKCLSLDDLVNKAVKKYGYTE